MFQGDIFITVKRPTVRSRLETIFYPYSLASWIVIVISFIVALAAMILCDKILLFVYEGKGIFHNFAITLSAIINDSSSRKMSLSSLSAAKMLVVSIWLPASMLLGLAYQSNLLASLIRTDFEPSISTFQDILDKPMFKVVVHNLTVVPLIMKNSPNPLVRQTYFQAVEKNGGLVNGFPKGLPLDDIMAGIAGMVMNPYTITGFRHMLQKGKHLTLDKPHSGYYFPVNFPIKRIIDFQIVNLKEMGIYEGLVTKYMWWKRRMEIWHKKYSLNYERDQAFLAKVIGNTDDQEKLSTEHLVAVILILAGGLGSASVAFVLEAKRLICRNMIETDLQLY